MSAAPGQPLASSLPSKAKARPSKSPGSDRALFSRLSLGALLPRPAASTVFRSPCTSCASSSAQRAAASLAATHDDDTIHWPPRTPSVYFIVRPHSRSPSSPAAFEPHCVEHTTCVTSALHCLTTLAPSLAASVFSRF